MDFSLIKMYFSKVNKPCIFTQTGIFKNGIKIELRYKIVKISHGHIKIHLQSFGIIFQLSFKRNNIPIFPRISWKRCASSLVAPVAGILCSKRHPRLKNPGCLCSSRDKLPFYFIFLIYTRSPNAVY